MTHLLSPYQTTRNLIEVYGDEFLDCISHALHTNKWHASVHVSTADEYRRMRCFVSETGSMGYALDGDILVSVFKNPSVINAAEVLIPHAIEQGARRLDCFEALKPLYERFGFVEYDRVAWNEAYRPAGWQETTYWRYREGHPDVVFMSQKSICVPALDGKIMA